MAKIGHARVSTRDQNPDAQGCERIFTDRASGKVARRPELDKALDYVRAGDQLVVTNLDRLGRSVRHLFDLVGDLGERGMDLRVLHQGIDITAPAGRLFFHLVGAFAEFERDLISERTHEGLDAARARGRAGGRPARMTPQKAALARFRIVIHSVSDDDERVIADHTVDAYVAAIGRRLPTGQFEHNTLLAGPLDLAVDLAAVIPDAMTHFINKHLPRR